MALLPFNEEKIKNSLVLPMLASASIQPEELEFETTFKIQLGRGVHTVHGAAHDASGRSDILCRRNGRPLFLIELKAEAEALTDTERQQGLSYARLLEPMAPYVLLSNGVETRLYDTVTGERIDQSGSVLLSEFRPSLETEIAIRFEALKLFIGLSSENLSVLCKSHNQAALFPFRAESDGPPSEQLQRKFIPSVYVRRRALEERFRAFLGQTDHVVFPVIGSSGTGKPNFLCFLAESVSEPTLFYSGTLLSTSFLTQFTSDFNLVFSAQEAPIALLKKISALGTSSGKRFTVFLDAIDEWESPDKIAELDVIVGIFKHLQMRLVVSCKSSHWRDFLRRKGVDGPINAALFPDTPELPDFDAMELAAAISRYSSLLSLDVPVVTPSKAFQNPFALRIACEVAYASKSALDVKAESRDTVRRYLVLKLEKTASPSTCRRLLVDGAGLMEQLDQVQVEEVAVRKGLGIGALQELPRDLFDHGILYRYVNESGTNFIGFYYSNIRDYLLACEVHQLQDCLPPVRVARLAGMYRTYVGESGAIYYSRTGSVKDRKDCLDAAYDVDEANRTIQVVRLLAWDGGAIVGELRGEDRERLLQHLETLLFANGDSITIADQILDVVTRLDVDTGVEEMLVRWLCRFADTGKGSFVMTAHRIADLLRTVDTPAQTEKLLSLVTDPTKDGYVRRYAIEALGGRTISDRRTVSLTLIRDPDPNVRGWVRGWYGRLEDKALRDSMFEMLRGQDLSAHVKEDIARAIGFSRLPDTGRRLLEWLTTLREADEEMLGWVCRALADLDYRPAISELIHRLKQHPNSRLGELIVTALGNMRAKEALPEVLSLLETGQGDDYWLALTLSRISSEEDLASFPTLHGRAQFAFLFACASKGEESAEIPILSLILDATRPRHWRAELLATWSDSVLGYVNEAGYVKEARQRRRASKELVTALHSLVGAHDELSPMALRLLIEFDEDFDRLADAICRELPRFRFPFSGRETRPFGIEGLASIGGILRPWLNRNLQRSGATVTLLCSCCALAELIGDESTWDAIQSNREVVETAVGEHSLRVLEHRLRSGPPPRASVEGYYDRASE
jgi:hypothetical protein